MRSGGRSRSRSKMAGVAADLFKFFDLVTPEAATLPLELVGLDPGVATALWAFYAGLRRIVTVNGAAGAKWEPSRSPSAPWGRGT